MIQPENQARTIFLEALERPADDRAQFIAQACGNDLELRDRVERLLRSHEQLGSFREDHANGESTRIGGSESPGSQIGPYKLLQKLGEGGMGTVFMAEQTSPVQRRVALKLIKPGMDSQQVIARFEAERQALSMMDHVNIARVLDVGATAQGRPYFVMELVHGLPITKYCDDHHLTPRQRLELFLPVCQAIQHAHQKGIIHRDIKPSNVMVTLYDDQPVPKVIDFGVAKATEQKLTDRTLFTHYGMMVGTLEYMSPEQAEMNALGVDTRSDIYSLGVLLYELLTGSTPISGKRMKAAAHAEIVRMIREDEPVKPSTRVSESGEALASISAQRRTQPSRLSKLMRGELDWIVMKTLEKDRNRRYESASSFAADLQRYLNHEPVEASPPSWWYRMRKYMRRNRGPLVTASILATALITGTAVSLWQAYEANVAHKLAVDRLQETESERHRADVSYRKARKTVKRLLEQVADDELVHTPGMRVLYFKLLGEAIASYEELSELKPDDADLFASQAELHMWRWDFKKAQLPYEKAVKLDPTNPRYHAGLAYVFDRCYRGDPAQLVRGLEHANRSIALGSDGKWSHVLRVLLNARLGRRAAVFDEIAILETGPLSPAECAPLCEACLTMGDATTGLRLVQRGLALEPTGTENLHLLATCYRALGDKDKSIEALSECLRHNKDINDPNYRGQLYQRGEEYFQLQRYQEAVADLRRCLELDPTDAQICGRCALANFHAKQYDKCLEDVQRWLQLDSTDASSLEGIIELAIGSDNEQFIERLLALGPHPKIHIVYRLQQIQRHIEQNQYTETLSILQLLEQEFPSNNDEAYQSKCNKLGNNLFHKAQYAAAIAAFNIVLRINPGASHIRVKRDLTALMEGKKEDLRTQLMAAIVQDWEQVASGGKPVHTGWVDVGHTWWKLAHYAQERGNLTAAEEYNRRALGIYQRLDHDYPTNLFYRQECAITWWNIAGLKRRAGDLPATAEALSNAAVLHEQLRQQSPQEPMYRDRYCRSLWEFAETLMLLDRRQEAIAARSRLEPLVAESVESARSEHGDDGVKTLFAMEQLAKLYEVQGKHQELKTLADKMLAGWQRQEVVHQIAVSRSFLGASYLGQGRLDEAEPLLLAGFEEVNATRMPGYSVAADLSDAAVRLAKFYEAKHDLEQVVRWQYEAQAALRIVVPKPPDPPVAAPML